MSLLKAPEQSTEPTPSFNSSMLRSVTEKMQSVQVLMNAIIVVLFIAFAATFVAIGGMITNGLAKKQASYNDLQDAILLQNQRVDILLNEIRGETTNSQPYLIQPELSP